jgi:AraC family transcriptional regulator
MAAQFHHTYSTSSWTPSSQPLPGVFVEEECGPGIFRKSTWRESYRVTRPSAIDNIIVATRWMDDRNSGRIDSAPSTPGRHEIAIALKTTRLKLSRDSHTLFEGLLPSGTVFVADAALPLKIDFQAPCDFIHLSVSNEWLSGTGSSETAPGAPGLQSFDGFTMRDALAEGLARSLIDVEAGCTDRYAESVGHTIVMRLLGALREQSKNVGSKISPLPRWRLKRVQDYVAANIGERISLPDIASIAGLSRMHFAAQFRAATGYRPHEYLLFCRVERAKAMLAQHETSIVEIALSVGFQSQAHFSTVFKRLTNQTPLGWRRASLNVSSTLPQTQRQTGGETVAIAGTR